MARQAFPGGLPQGRRDGKKACRKDVIFRFEVYKTEPIVGEQACFDTRCAGCLYGELGAAFVDALQQLDESKYFFPALLLVGAEHAGQDLTVIFILTKFDM